MGQEYTRQIVLFFVGNTIEETGMRTYFEKKWGKRPGVYENHDIFFIKPSMRKKMDIFDERKWINIRNTGKTLFQSMRQLDNRSRLYIVAHGEKGCNYVQVEDPNNVEPEKSITRFQIESSILAELIYKNLSAPLLFRKNNRGLTISLVACEAAAGNSTELIGGEFGVPNDCFAYNFFEQMYHKGKIDCDVVARRYNTTLPFLHEKMVKTTCLDHIRENGIHHRPESKVLISYYCSRVTVTDVSEIPTYFWEHYITLYNLSRNLVYEEMLKEAKLIWQLYTNIQKIEDEYDKMLYLIKEIKILLLNPTINKSSLIPKIKDDFFMNLKIKSTPTYDILKNILDKSAIYFDCN